ncbi:amidophosphoribosyltransferase [Tannerella forsythia]|uniref:amidophosphoribosyltransferase n=1 Tax=Tannerella forsythia TaxID=28112 RepID=UPI0028F0C63F|nr:amidophosphoribosyltransferase [Tannerella forsythia]
METLKHECGVAMIRLLKPLEYYHRKYGTWMYALNKLYLLMEKQHNRGQDGAGLACVKFEAAPGEEYMFRERAAGTDAITEIFDTVYGHYKGIPAERLSDPQFAQANLPFAAELYMGHLRYSTTGKSGLSYIHPFLRRNNWRARNLALCGNFNMTNVHSIFKEITATGQHPRQYADTYFILEQLGHLLDREAERLFRKYEAEGMQGREITCAIEENIDLTQMIGKAASTWDGGYVICGITGSGESFTVRDPWGIRTAFYYADDEIIVTASERPVIQTVMNVQADDVKELQRGEALMVNRKGEMRTVQLLDRKPLSACSFERIYFSRGSDRDIYRERKRLGENLVDSILKKVDCDIEHTVFSYIPNTAEMAYYGMMEGLQKHLDRLISEQLSEKGTSLSEEEIRRIFAQRIRSEKVILKDIKLRTFIAEGNTRNDLAAHVYDITYGSITPHVDNLVIIDDSIVRGTTLKQSIVSILDRLHPKKIVVVSSSPQIRYPDYYGIDMSSMGEFIAFRMAIELLISRGMEHVIIDTYNKAKQQQGQPENSIVNCVKDIYAPFTDEDISDKMAQMLSGKDIHAGIEIVFQTLDGLHEACPDHPGDWYFSGDYPTPGGTRLVNQAFIHYVEQSYLKRGRRII